MRVPSGQPGIDTRDAALALEALAETLTDVLEDSAFPVDDRSLIDRLLAMLRGNFCRYDPADLGARIEEMASRRPSMVARLTSAFERRMAIRALVEEDSRHGSVLYRVATAPLLASHYVADRMLDRGATLTLALGAHYTILTLTAAGGSVLAGLLHPALGPAVLYWAMGADLIDGSLNVVALSNVQFVVPRILALFTACWQRGVPFRALFCAAEAFVQGRMAHRRTDRSTNVNASRPIESTFTGGESVATRRSAAKAPAASADPVTINAAVQATLDTILAGMLRTGSPREEIHKAFGAFRARYLIDSDFVYDLFIDQAIAAARFPSVIEFMSRCTDIAREAGRPRKDVDAIVLYLMRHLATGRTDPPGPATRAGVALDRPDGAHRAPSGHVARGSSVQGRASAGSPARAAIPETHQGEIESADVRTRAE